MSLGPRTSKDRPKGMRENRREYEIKPKWMPMISALGRLKHRNAEFEANLGYTVRPWGQRGLRRKEKTKRQSQENNYRESE